MAKQKQVFDKEKHEAHKVLHIPTPRKGQVFKDKTKYTRKVKHKKKIEKE